MTKDQATGLAGVAESTSPQQAGKAQDPWGWVEPSVWTERMLTRLEQSEPTTVGFDRRMWPNRWFAEQGLFSLEHGSCTYG